jgi:hypothetical protein
MNYKPTRVCGLVLALIAGCGPSVSEPPAPPARPTYSVQRPVVPANAPPSVSVSAPEISWETDRDRAYATFLKSHSAGLIRKAAVGLADRGELRVEISKAVEPEDTLDLAKSLLSGARKDFPDKPITLSLYDPNGEPILKAHYRPKHGVHYQIAHGGPSTKARASTESVRAPAPKESSSEPLGHSGVTSGDRKFATWAEEHGRSYLRYVQADLERHGRLWFGVTREVKPADVPKLTQSLLAGAQKEFPKRELVATVFDPEGERIGRAHMSADGQIRWEH